jgi:hypothetical protein
MKSSESRISTWFRITKTYCVGRFLIDVPSQAEVVYGPAYLAADIIVIRSGAVRFDEILKDDQQKIKRESHLAEQSLAGPSSMLGKVIDGVVNGQKILFAMSGGSGSRYELRSYTPIGKDLLLAWSSAAQEPSRYQERVDHLNAISRRASKRAEDEIPTSPGMCIEGAFIAPLDSFNTERVTFGVRLDDVHFSMEMTAKAKLVESDGLKWRVEDAAEEARKRGGADWYSRIKFFKRGERTIGGWNGYEVMARKPAQKVEHRSHEFAFVSHGEPMNPMLPVLDLSLHTGVDGNEQGARPPSISDHDAIALWEKLIGSIRQRPTSSKPVMVESDAAK